MVNRRQNVVIVPTAVVLLCAPLCTLIAQERTVDPNALSTRTCQALIIDSIEEEFPKAKNVAWDMDSVRVTDTRGGVRLIGEGHYKGGSSRRAFDFECDYSSKKDEVVSAWWVSSFDRKRRVVVEDESASPMSALEVGEACLSAVEDFVREGFPSTVSKLELIEDSLELADPDEFYELTGQGRFRGGGGNWHRFEFACTYDETEEEVRDASWKHLGDERDLG